MPEPGILWRAVSGHVPCRGAGGTPAAGPRTPILLEQPVVFRRETLDQLLAQPGCTGIRVYPAQHDDVKPTLVVVGVDALGNDLATGLLMQWPFECPPYCSEENPLNMD